MPHVRFPGPCVVCGDTDSSGYYKKQMCNKCYRRQKRISRGLRPGGAVAYRGPCIHCGATESSNGRFTKKMCVTCYKRLHRSGNDVARIRYPGPCIVCGSTTARNKKNRFVKRMCHNCYKMAKHAEKVASIKRTCSDCGVDIARLSKTGRCRNCQHAWRYANDEAYRDGFKRRQREYLKTDKGKKFSSLHNRNRQAVRYGASANLSDKDWCAILDHFDFRCAYCLDPFDKLEQDHVVPISKGGVHNIYNVVPACRTCNAKKKDGPPLRPVITYGEYLDSLV